ncbi:hypothetical protein JCM1840_003761 [Sporobolomyces johnsonii]
MAPSTRPSNRERRFRNMQSASDGGSDIDFAEVAAAPVGDRKPSFTGYSRSTSDGDDDDQDYDEEDGADELEGEDDDDFDPSLPEPSLGGASRRTKLSIDTGRAASYGYSHSHDHYDELDDHTHEVGGFVPHPSGSPSFSAPVQATSRPAAKRSASGQGGRAADPNKDKPFVCEYADCEKAFARRSDLVRHARIHTNERPFVCPYSACRKSFIQRSALTVHIRVHTGERPHTCDTCGRSFSDSSSLARHRRVHEFASTGKRPYKCDVPSCGRTFCRKTTLTKHVARNHPDSSDPIALNDPMAPLISSSRAAPHFVAPPPFMPPPSPGMSPHSTHGSVSPHDFAGHDAMPPLNSSGGGQGHQIVYRQVSGHAPSQPHPSASIQWAPPPIRATSNGHYVEHDHGHGQPLHLQPHQAPQLYRSHSTPQLPQIAHHHSQSQHQPVYAIDQYGQPFEVVDEYGQPLSAGGAHYDTPPHQHPRSAYDHQQQAQQHFQYASGSRSDPSHHSPSPPNSAVHPPPQFLSMRTQSYNGQLSTPHSAHPQHQPQEQQHQLFHVHPSPIGTPVSGSVSVSHSHPPTTHYSQRAHYGLPGGGGEEGLVSPAETPYSAASASVYHPASLETTTTTHYAESSQSNSAPTSAYYTRPTHPQSSMNATLASAHQQTSPLLHHSSLSISSASSSHPSPYSPPSHSNRSPHLERLSARFPPTSNYFASPPTSHLAPPQGSSLSQFSISARYSSEHDDGVDEEMVRHPHHQHAMAAAAAAKPRAFVGLGIDGAGPMDGSLMRAHAHAQGGGGHHAVASEWTTEGEDVEGIEA